MSAAALLAFEGRARDGFGNCEQMFQINRRVPAGIVFTMAMDSDILRAIPKFAQSVERANHFLFAPYDADEALHHFLQIDLHLVRAFRVAGCFCGSLERFQRLTRGFLNLAIVDLTRIVFAGKIRGEFARALAEYEQVRQ